MRQANSYQSWCDLAQELDRLEGNDAWREEPTSPHYDHELIAEHLQLMRRYRVDGNLPALRRLIEESLHRNLGDLSNPLLYEYSHYGTKLLIESYLDEVEFTLDWLCDTPLPGFTDKLKLATVREALRVFGRSALILSGGGALGLFHLGVVKTLWELDLLPNIISGASMGAIVAGGACVRNDDEIHEIWSDLHNIHRRAVRIQSLKGVLKDGCLFAPEQLYEHIEANLADMTFQEAYKHSGRVLNIAVSPTRHRQKPRLLNHLTSPQVLINHAAVASCSLPALFPPAGLLRRGPDGEVQPYIQGEMWIDGSLHGDVPIMRLSRLHNVNHYIVSQANIHVVPFAGIKGREGILSTVAELAASGAHAQSQQLLGLARRRLRGGLWNPTMEWMHALLNQNYAGDINIHPRMKTRDLLRVMKNPSLKELQAYVTGGERATWPKVAMIRNQTRMSRVMERCIKRLETRLKNAPTTPDEEATS